MPIVQVSMWTAKCNTCGDTCSSAGDPQRAAIFAHMNGWRIHGDVLECVRCWRAAETKKAQPQKKRGK